MQTMIITYFGKQFFKIQQGETVLSFNPVSKSSKSSINAHFGADIALITTNHPDYNGIEQLSHGERIPFVITGPGDYEIKEIFIKGVLGDALIAGKKYINTIYSLSVDDISIVFLGALGVLADSEISKEAREAMNNPDLLFIPIGGNGLLDAKSAAKLASSLEPSIIIPMDFDDSSLKAFLKETGEEKAEVVDKLTLKAKDLEGKEGEVVVLKKI
ncbi:MAG: Zn-dependent hydrolase of the beta-lactamase fold-like protein [Parcubacteria group bacterium GW2011_GWB1_37_13]|uniref:Zn-dependent hydrolase of the beta-lactamase fold-like protein n=1 Tax=Candidatus Yanofskybacteria bacterium GW2011_GWC2_37_9 TaxID=1619028 RepID=A0A0G0I7M6_9BACT|nr:MAG: Zn-dependent hydrolase of the beta-lactamase fold-like protein [Parcubacteria group bacterium GW2011_GWB1_37_13]KKQ46985.1 MAG: Zn-dependent hydrolase of the beta-lactamase fold-like protein [Candidatus Yanofskybacteria bacterium GW2011_GWC2_37_9]